jgi:hypothetical protein
MKLWICEVTSTIVVASENPPSRYAVQRYAKDEDVWDVNMREAKSVAEVLAEGWEADSLVYGGGEATVTEVAALCGLPKETP